MDIKYYAIAILFLSSIMTGALAAYSTLNFRTSGAKSYACLMVCITIYSFGYALELYNTTLDGILFASRIQYLGIPFIPVFWLMVAARYAGHWKKLPRYFYPLLFMVPLTTLAFRYADEHLHLVYQTVMLNETGPFPVLNITRGVWYHVHIVYSYGCILLGNLFFLRMALRAVGPYRNQALMLAGFSLLPWAADITYQRGLSPFDLDLTPFAFAVVGPTLAWGVFRFRIFDFVPIARDTIFDFMRDPVMAFDTADRLVDYNRSAATIFDYLDQRSVGTDAKDIFTDCPALLECMNNGSSENRDIRIRCAGEVHVFELSIAPMVPKRQHPVGRIIILHEVTEQRELMERLRDLATLDGLTGIYNHRHLMDMSQKELDRAQRHGHPITLLLADLDFFKQVNDTHGHQAGDEVLREVAAVFQKNLRSSDILGRYGGEEFAVLLPETLAESGMELADRIRDDLASLTVRYGDQDIAITASFGVSGYRFDGDHTDDLVSLFKRADKMLYKAKNSGRNLVVQAEDTED